MILSIINNTGSSVSLLSGSVVVPASGSIAVTSTVFQYQLATDGFCRQNIINGVLCVSDGTNNFGSTDAINYLYLLFQALGPLADGSGNQITSTTVNSKQRIDISSSSEGSDNAAVPFSTTQVGGRDPSGNLQALITVPSGEQFVRDVINVSSQYRAQSVTTTAAQALGGATVLVNRKVITITPTNGTIYWGGSSAVTTATGTPLFAFQTLTLAFTDLVPVYVISAGTVDVRILEGS